MDYQTSRQITEQHYSVCQHWQQMGCSMDMLVKYVHHYLSKLVPRCTACDHSCFAIIVMHMYTQRSKTGQMPNTMAELQRFYRFDAIPTQNLHLLPIVKLAISDTCGTCLQCIPQQTFVHKLPACGHVFHLKHTTSTTTSKAYDLLNWLRFRNTCPAIACEANVILS